MFDQSSRLIRLVCPLPEDSFAVASVMGEEMVAGGFVFTAHLVSNSPIDDPYGACCELSNFKRPI